MGSTISWETQEGGKNIPKSNKCFVPGQGQGAAPGVCCEGGRVAWDLCVTNRTSSVCSVLLRERENPLWSPDWKCITVLLQGVLGVLCGALTGGQGVPGCTKRLNMGLCVYIYLFIFK